MDIWAPEQGPTLMWDSYMKQEMQSSGLSCPKRLMWGEE